MKLKIESINVPIDLKWKSNPITIAGGNGQGQQMNQLYHPWSISIDDNKTIYVVDQDNHRIVEWKKNSTIGRIVAGGNEKGNGYHQLNYPTKVIIDKINDCFIIADCANRRVVRWPRQNGQSGQIIINDVKCIDIVMHENEYLYVCDDQKHEVRRWKIGESQGVIVAGGNGKGDLLNQLNEPSFISIDEDETTYVSDYGNHRVMKWLKGAEEGIIVAGGQGEGNSLKQLSYPEGIVIDRSGTLYVSDWGNHRIVRWIKNAKEGTIIAGGNKRGNQSNQLDCPAGLSFDDENNLYIADFGNHRIQKYFVDK